MYIWIDVGLLPKLETCWNPDTTTAEVVGADVVVVVVIGTVVIRVVIVVEVVPLTPPGHPAPGVHCAYHGFWVLQQLPPTQFVAPVHPIPPHCPQRVCWANALPAKRARERMAKGIVKEGAKRNVSRQVWEKKCWNRTMDCWKKWQKAWRIAMAIYRYLTNSHWRCLRS